MKKTPTIINRPLVNTAEDLARIIQTLDPSITDTEALAQSKFLFLHMELREKERRVHKVIGILIGISLLIIISIILATNLNWL